MPPRSPLAACPRRAARRRWLLAALALAVLAEAAPAQRARPPRSGQELIARMHDRYAGRWFRTLTFVQTTELRRRDGTDTTETWYEALRAPDRLRIDRGAPSEGNGMLFTPESTYVARGGRVVEARARGNELIPFVAGVYTQPVDSTLRDLAALPVDMGRVGEGKWRGRRAYIVGAANAADSLAPQFWVDRERLVLVRIVLPPARTGRPCATCTSTATCGSATRGSRPR
jgi:hypothetical protein